MVKLSVIMPAYNEAESIVEAVNDIRKSVISVVSDVEIIVIDDGSTDSTRSLLTDVCAQEPLVRVVTQENQGHGPALMRGLAEANGAYLLLLDSDRQIQLDGFSDHWALLQGKELFAFFGIRRPRHDPPHRLVITRLMRAFIALAFGRSPKDAGVPYKLIRRDAWDEASQLIAPDCWVPSVLLAIILLNRHPDRVRQEAVVHLKRDSGVSTLNYRKLFGFCSHAASDILRLRRDMKLRR